MTAFEALSLMYFSVFGFANCSGYGTVFRLHTAERRAFRSKIGAVLFSAICEGNHETLIGFLGCVIRRQGFRRHSGLSCRLRTR